MKYLSFSVFERQNWEKASSFNVVTFLSNISLYQLYYLLYILGPIFTHSFSLINCFFAHLLTFTSFVCLKAIVNPKKWIYNSKASVLREFLQVSNLKWIQRNFKANILIKFTWLESQNQCLKWIYRNFKASILIKFTSTRKPTSLVH